MIEVLLLTLRDTEVSDAIPLLIQAFENVTGSVVMVTQAENGRRHTLFCEEIAKTRIVFSVDI